MTLGELISRINPKTDCYYIIVDNCDLVVGCGKRENIWKWADKEVKDFELSEKELFVEVSENAER